jgi:hypothetical protein
MSSILLGGVASFLLSCIGILQEIPVIELDVDLQYQTASIDLPLSDLNVETYWMNFSSSGLWALIGGAAAFGAFEPPMLKVTPPPSKPRVSIASYTSQ